MKYASPVLIWGKKTMSRCIGGFRNPTFELVQKRLNKPDL